MYAEIVAQDRDRPIGPILFDICVDLGIVPAQMDPATWDELRLALTLYGADPAPFETRAIPALPTSVTAPFPLPTHQPLTTSHGPLASRIPHGRRHFRSTRLPPAPAHPRN